MSTKRTQAEHDAWVQGYCNDMGNPRAAPKERENISTAAGYYEKNFDELFPSRAGASEAERRRAINQEMKGIDFKKPVRERELEPGQTLGRYEYTDQAKNPDPSRPSRFFGPTGNSASSSGISDHGRVYQQFKVREKTTVLESRASSVNDTWTETRGKERLPSDATTQQKADRWKETARPTQGGGAQYVITPSEQKKLDHTYQQIRRDEPRVNRHDRARAERSANTPSEPSKNAAAGRGGAGEAKGSPEAASSTPKAASPVDAPKKAAATAPPPRKSR